MDKSTPTPRKGAKPIHTVSRGVETVVPVMFDDDDAPTAPDLDRAFWDAFESARKEQEEHHGRFGGITHYQNGVKELINKMAEKLGIKPQ